MLKLAFYVDSLLRGGTEKVAINLSNSLKEFGYDTTMLANAREDHWGDEILSNKAFVAYNGCTFLGKMFEIKQIAQNFDIIFSNIWIWRQLCYSNYEVFMIYLYYPNKLVNICHIGELDRYFSRHKKLAYHLHLNIINVVSICEAMKSNIELEYQFKNVKNIYNSTDIESIQAQMNENIDIDYKYIIGVGRISAQKNFVSLVKAYNSSNLKIHDVKLVLLGRVFEEDCSNEIDDEINKLGLSDYVVRLGEQSNPFKYMKNSLFMVMTSKYEGFPMVIGECLATGTPVISYDLYTGPNEIITHEFNGLLVENQNEDSMTNAINRLYLDKDLYAKCKSNAIASIQRFDIKSIIKEWEVLINFVNDNQDSINELKTHQPGYINPYGDFSIQELLLYISTPLNYFTISPYIGEISHNVNTSQEFESNIYDLIDRFCFVFKCSNEFKNSIKIKVAIEIIASIKDAGFISEYLKNKLLINLNNTSSILKNNDALVYLIMKRRNEHYSVSTDRWYNFGKLTLFGKIKQIIKMLAKKILSIFLDKLNKIFNLTNRWLKK